MISCIGTTVKELEHAVYILIHIQADFNQAKLDGTLGKFMWAWCLLLTIDQYGTQLCLATQLSLKSPSTQFRLKPFS